MINYHEQKYVHEHELFSESGFQVFMRILNMWPLPSVTIVIFFSYF